MIYGLMCIDQDAKVIAVNEWFDKSINVWDLSALGAAMYGVSRQGMEYFKAEGLERGSMIFKDKQFFSYSIGTFNLDEKANRELLILVLCDRKVNIGLIILQMKKYAAEIREEIEKNSKIKDTLKLSEEQMRQHIKDIKADLFRQAKSMNLVS